MKKHTRAFISIANLILCLIVSPLWAQNGPMPPEDLRIGTGGTSPPSPPPPPPPPTVSGQIGEIAAGMSPGSWVTVSTNGFNNGNVLLTPENGSVLEFTDEAVWDPTHKKLYIIGTARGNGGYGIPNQKWVEFSEATNTWTDLTPTLPNGFYIGRHTYNHTAFDASRGHFYVRFDKPTDPTVIYRYDTAASTWQQIPNMPGTSNLFAAIEYFPERGRLVFTDTGGKFSIFDPDSNQWTTEPWNGTVFTDHNFAEYDPVNGLLYFGGGHNAPSDFFKMDRNGTVTKLAAPPIPLGISGSCTIHTVDPVSGKFLVMEIDGIIYEYDSATDSWKTAGTHPLAVLERKMLMAVTAKIPEYGVLIAVSFNPTGSTNGVYLYKH